MTLGNSMRQLLRSNVNREAWLTEMAREVEQLFRGFKLKPYRVTCGFPSKSATGRRFRRVGECHSQQASTGGVHEIFIHPTLDNSLEVAGVLTHELAHVAAGVEAGHGKSFRRVCQHVGLTKGKPTHAMPSDALNDHLKRLVEVHGAYPHKSLLIVPKVALRQPSVARLVCHECGCVVTESYKWIGQSGLPTCGCGGSFSRVDETP